jgi:capsular polysaccharide transport system permease protein
LSSAATADPEIPVPPQRPARTGRSHPALRAIMAMMLREMGTRFGRSPGGYIWILIQPLGMIIILGVAWSMLQRNPSLGTSFILFKATGFLILTMFRTISQMTGMALKFSRNLLDYPGVTWIDALLARFILNALAITLVAAIILTGTVVYEELRLVLAWPKILASIVLALMLGFGVGCLNVVLFMRFDFWQQTWGILTAPLVLVSGVLILYEDLPRIAQQILWYNPLYHLTGLMRDGFYSTYNPTYISVPYVLAWVLVPMVTGLLLLRRFNRYLLQR